MNIETRVFPIQFEKMYTDFIDDKIGIDYETNYDYELDENGNEYPANFHLVVFEAEPSEYKQIIEFEEKLISYLFSFEDLFSIDSFILSKQSSFKVSAEMLIFGEQDGKNQKKSITLTFPTWPAFLKEIKEILETRETNWVSFPEEFDSIEFLEFTNVCIVATVNDWELKKEYYPFWIRKDSTSESINDILLK